jgi:peroxiredoxin
MQHDRGISASETDTLAAIAMAAASAAASAALRAGARVPTFTLSDRQGGKVSLDDLLTSGPVVLNFVRGSWCAFGEASLAQLAMAYDRITALGAKAVSIAPLSRPAKAGNTPRMPELIDTDMKVARAFGLAFELPAELRPRYLELGYTPPRTQIARTFLVPIPAMYLVDPDGVVVLAYVDVDYRNRLDGESLLTALKALSARCETGAPSARQLAVSRARIRRIR